MKHYERRFQEDLDALVGGVAEVARLVTVACHEAVAAALAGDEGRAAQVILGDNPINRLVRKNDAACHAFVARHYPAAGPLRLVSSLLRVDVALERVGDYAVTICRVATQRKQPIPAEIAPAVRALATSAFTMLDMALRAFLSQDEALARRAIGEAPGADRAHDVAFELIVGGDHGLSVREVAGLLTVIASLERVSDQAKNLAEESLFVALGETKQPKIWRVLFVDATDALVAPLARAIASKSWGEAGRFYSAGVRPANELDPDLDAVADRLGLDVRGAMPRPVLPLDAAGTQHHVVVVLDPEITPPTSFHSVRVRWDVPPVPALGEPGRPAAIDALARDLAAQINGLMHVLRGPN
jgi:phosphate transport system protein